MYRQTLQITEEKMEISSAGQQYLKWWRQKQHQQRRQQQQQQQQHTIKGEMRLKNVFIW